MSKNNFRDRTPNILAAGCPLKKSDRAEECLKIYPIDDAIITILDEAGLHKVPLKEPIRRPGPCRHAGIYTQVRELVSPSVESRYQTLLRDLKETNWNSYWLKDLGQSSDSIGGVPPHITKSTKFGRPTPIGPSVASLINPRKSILELRLEDAEYHNIYKQTHNDYLPSERRNRRYESPPFDPNARFGIKFPKFRTTLSCALQTNTYPTAVANQVLTDFKARNAHHLGVVLAPNKNVDYVPLGYRFGKQLTLNHSMAELMQPHIENMEIQADFHSALASLWELRSAYAKRVKNFTILHQQCTHAADGDAWLKVDAFFKILQDNRLAIPTNQVMEIAKCYGMFQNNLVHYNSVLDMLNSAEQLPDFSFILKNNGERPNEFNTTYRTNYGPNLACISKNDNTRKPCAGIGSFPEESSRPVRTKTEIRKDENDLGGETDVSVLIEPSILTNYGLSHIDLLTFRDAEYMHILFERLGYKLPQDVFEKLWKYGQEVDNSKDGVSVDTFYKLIQQATPLLVHLKDDFCVQ